MEARRKWADSESDDEEEREVENTEGRVITSLPSLESNNKSQKAKKKVKVKKSEHEEKVDPNLVTKITNSEVKTDTKSLRPDGTTASKKEIKEKELEELNKLLAEFGTPQETEVETEEKKTQKEQEKNTKSKKAKPSKKEIFENVRSEIVARTEKSKKSKKKDKFTNFT